MSILFFVNINLFAQTTIKKTNSTPQKSTIAIPNERNINTIVDFVKKNFKTDEEKAGAVYYWITNSFNYDVKNMYNVLYYQNNQQIIDDFINSGKGVCAHYTTTFSKVCNLLGIKSYTVEGYTKQNGKLDALAHSWNVSFINGKWEIIDPTWGAGYVQDGKFVKKFNSFYFLTDPKEFIQSHCPFDPIWQLLPQPVSYSNFDNNINKTDKDASKISFNDSIIVYEKRDTVTHYNIYLQKLKRIDSPNFQITRRTEQVKSMLNQIKKQNSINSFNKAIQFFNESVKNENEFVEYFNRQFTPPKSDNLIQFMLFNIEVPLDSCKKIISGIEYSDPMIKYNIAELQKDIVKIEESLADYKEFTKKYIETPKFFRTHLFYRPIKKKVSKT